MNDSTYGRSTTIYDWKLHCDLITQQRDDLLEALRNCLDVLEDFDHIVPFLQAAEQARAAIAKAK